MKRQMVGGAHRGPVGAQRQRRTIRFVQILLVLIAAGLLMFAGYSLGRSSAVRGDDLSQPRDPGAGQTIALFILGVGAFGASLALQGSGGVRLPTPYRLRDLDGGGDGPIPLEPDGSIESNGQPTDRASEQTS